MKKNYFLSAIMALALCCGLLATSCGDDDTNNGDGNNKIKYTIATKAGVAYEVVDATMGEYTIILSTAKIGNDGKYTSAGDLVALSMISGIAADPAKARPAEGIYTLNKSDDIKTFDIYQANSIFQKVIQKGAAFEQGAKIKITEAAVVVKHVANDGFEVAVLLTLEDGSKANIIAKDFIRGEIGGDGDGDDEYQTAAAGFVSYDIASPTTGLYSLIIAACDVDEDGNPASLGHAIKLDVLSDIATDPSTARPAEGTYNWSDSEDKFTIYPDLSECFPIIESGNQFVEGDKIEITTATIIVAHVGTTNFEVHADITLAGGVKLKIYVQSFIRDNDGPGGGGDGEYLMANIGIMNYLNASATLGAYQLMYTDASLDEDGNLNSVGHFPSLMLISNKAENPQQCRPAEGTYTYGTVTKEGAIFSELSEYAVVTLIDGAYERVTGTAIKNAVVVVTHEGTIGYKIISDITLADDTVIKIACDSFVNITEEEETDEIVMNLKDAKSGIAQFWGDADKTGTGNWTIIVDDENCNEAIAIEMFMESVTSTEIPTGKFTADPSGKGLTFSPGMPYDGKDMPTLWMCYSPLQTEYITAGEITVSKEGSNYKIVFATTSESNKSVTGEWTGPLTFVDNRSAATQSTAKGKKLNKTSANKISLKRSSVPHLSKYLTRM